MRPDDRPPRRWYFVLTPFFLATSYLMFDIPYFLHDTFGYGFCDTGGPCTRLFDNVPWMMLPLALTVMFNWWALFFGLLWMFDTGRWKPEVTQKA